ncbi:type I-B CRISPR-associated protein Cas5b [Mesoaciditoga lauensis]|uniref:type I-B CRISPR-associated protein Cas5b n=1 Tax=Mesoaciditoga lauensis TaxID=1495039 RepID=UPI00055EC6EC|nr:type I-B CRISPR-associated protein Cas5b [Mesoaciditoga lauensis]
MPVVFDVAGSVAMFRKPYTTTSSVSYPFPPPSAVAGIISAIVGLENGAQDYAYSANFWEKISGNKVGIKLISDIKWYKTTLNFWNVKEPQKNPHIQIKHQFVKDPAYRIYVNGPIEEQLEKYLSKNSFVYTPYLGVAYAIAEIKYVGRFENKENSKENFVTETIVPYDEDISDGVEVDVLKSGGLHREIVPFKMDNERNLERVITVLYSANKKRQGIFIKKAGKLEVSRVGKDTVVWFPEW